MLVAEHLKVRLKPNRGNIGSSFSGERLPQFLRRNSRHRHYLNASGHFNNCGFGGSCFGMLIHSAQPQSNPHRNMRLMRQHPVAIPRRSFPILSIPLVLVLNQDL
jgi:hypothetical protein